MNNSNLGSLETLLRPFLNFVRHEALGGLLLIFATIIALLWANSPWGESYAALWATRFSVGLGQAALSKPILLWVNDGLMAVFFFLVGLEIKREILAGELSTPRKALLPIMAAVGGMMVPALLYFTLNPSTPGANGWGVPMATDIAFALGILTLLGDRVPAGLKIFLAAVAIVDDIGAVLVIALFYTSSISWVWLAWAGAALVLLALLNAFSFRHPAPYLLLAVFMWFAILKSGVHATVAGVLAAMTIPANTKIRADLFAETAARELEQYAKATRKDDGVLSNPEQHAALSGIEEACLAASSPLQRIEHTLHPWVAYGIMPIFALANAGIVLGGDVVDALTTPVSLGVIAGLVLGKPIGVLLPTVLAIRAGLAEAPFGVGRRHLFGVSCLAGIGFTMSIFIASLAFSATGPEILAAKAGILAASTVSAIAGWLVLRKA